MRPRLSWLASAALGIVTVMVLILIAGPTAFAGSLARLTPQSVVLAFALEVAFFLVRAMRWVALLKPQGATTHQTLLAATGFGYLVNLLIPIRIGEIARALVVSGKYSINPGGVLGTVVVERVLDLSYLLGVLGLSIIVLPVSSMQEPIRTVIQISALISFLGIAAIVAVVVLRERALRFLGPILDKLFPPALSRRTFSFVESLTRGSVFPKGLRENLKLNALSLVIVLLQVETVVVLVESMNLGLSFGTIFLGSAVSILGAIVPAPPGNLGTFEVIWIATFVALGLGQSEAIASGVSVHLVTLLFVLLIGVPSLMWLGVRLTDYVKMSVEKKG